MFGRKLESLGFGPRAPMRALGVALACGLVSACGSFTKTDEMVSTDPPNVIYNRAETLLDKHKYGDAAKEYEKVDVNHPYSQEARRAIVLAAYAHYQQGKYIEAISAADRFHIGSEQTMLSIPVSSSRLRKVTPPAVPGRCRWVTSPATRTRRLSSPSPSDPTGRMPCSSSWRCRCRSCCTPPGSHARRA